MSSAAQQHVRADLGETVPTVLADVVDIVRRARLGVYGIHLHRAGHDDVEVRFRSDEPTPVFSCSKTFTALAFGILHGEGRIQLDDRLVDVVPHSGPVAEGVDQITMRHLLTMTSGSTHTVFTDEEKDTADVAAGFLAAPLATPPGERFEYSNGSTYMLGRAVAAVAGTSVREFCMPRIFEPLGIINPVWAQCRAGHTWSATGLYLRTHELARMGQLLLQRGGWKGAQLVPSEWVDAMHADWVPTHRDDEPESVRYGFQVWDCTPAGAWRADGNRGQFVVVLPHQDAVVTVTSHEEHAMFDVLRAVHNGVLPHLG